MLVLEQDYNGCAWKSCYAIKLYCEVKLNEKVQLLMSMMAYLFGSGLSALEMNVSVQFVFTLNRSF